MHSSARFNDGEDNNQRHGSTNNMNILNPNMISNNVVDFSIGSMPANYGYDESFIKEEDPNDSHVKPRILIMGLRR